MKFFNKSKKYFAAPLVLTGAGSALATVDYSTLTTAVDFTTATEAILTVAAALVLVYIAWKGAKMILSAVRGG